LRSNLKEHGNCTVAIKVHCNGVWSNPMNKPAMAMKWYDPLYAKEELPK